MAVEAEQIEGTERQLPQIVTECLKKPGSVASLPTVAAELMRLADHPESDLNEIVGVINTDPALCARVLKVANSSYYGFSRTIASIKHATTLLGLNAVKNIAVAASLHKVFRPHHNLTTLNPRDLWVHSLAVAIAAREISKATGVVAADEAFLAGLMHDVGIIVEMQAFRAEFAAFEKLILERPEIAFRGAERHSFGASHEDFGAGLCQMWKFPRTMEDAIANHHATDISVEFGKLPLVIHVAELVAARAGFGFSREADSCSEPAQLLEHLSVSEAQLQSIADELPGDVNESLPLFAM